MEAVYLVRNRAVTQDIPGVGTAEFCRRPGPRPRSTAACPDTLLRSLPPSCPACGRQGEEDARPREPAREGNLEGVARTSVEARPTNQIARKDVLWLREGFGWNASDAAFVTSSDPVGLRIEDPASTGFHIDRIGCIVRISKAVTVFNLVEWLMQSVTESLLLKMLRSVVL